MIEFNNVYKSFDNKEILKDCSFKFENETKYLLYGESGIGKTTLLNLIVNYIKPDKGTIVNFLNEKKGYLFQEVLLFSNLTVEENLQIINKKNNNDIEFLSQIKEMFERFNIESLRKRLVSSLSGGEKRKIEIIGLILKNSDVILMDEPTANMDMESKKSIIRLIDEVFKEKIVIIASHDDRGLFSGYTPIKLNGGKIIDGEEIFY
ncbi:MAG: ABC transporter ATP-binding protein [Lachnospiraceae bacterium]|jgi:ABC-type multidrug transport system ATPase subunit|nr:ABC transporter ATP-binding protein [Lachnospiraceae bacterium]